jgi:hypothetical protein
MNIPLSLELADIYPKLIEEQIEREYQNLRPSDITRYILKIFDDKELTVDIAYHLISNLHDHFSSFDYDKISEVSGFNIQRELREAKELFRDREKYIPRAEVRV